MKIEIFDRIQTEQIDMMRFVLEGVNVELANAFRRIILTEVPTMAIKEVLFVENDSVLFDEMLAHRLGLIPLTTDLTNYNLPDECSCGGKGCTLCQVQFVFEARSENSPKYVYSGSLESMDPKIHPVSDKVIIGKLGKNSSLIFEAFAQLGRGKDHAKFQPVCSVGYKYYPKITIDNSKFSTKAAERKEQILSFLTKDYAGIFKYNESKNELDLITNYWQGPDITQSIKNYAPQGAIKIEFEPNKFIFTVEGTGALEIKEILAFATGLFLEKIDEMEEQLKDIKVEPRIIPLEVR